MKTESFLFLFFSFFSFFSVCFWTAESFSRLVCISLILEKVCSRLALDGASWIPCFTHIFPHRTVCTIMPLNIAASPQWEFGGMKINSKTANFLHFLTGFYRSNARVKKILEKLSRTRFFTGFEIRALFFSATQQRRKGANFKSRKKSCSWWLF